jgi:hypothetical protein
MGVFLTGLSTHYVLYIKIITAYPDVLGKHFLGRETGVDVDSLDRRDVMSKRFLRWVETWIDENILPGANPDIESHEVKAKRLTEKLFAEAVTFGFTASESEEERERVLPLVLAAVSDSTDFDIDAYRLKSELARENEDGD